ncbi:radical SAM protein [Thermodesulfovibrio sp. 1176]|uniref:radical SAM protein n=1 Tax=Thermodesulfovibrio sp. 1176 TaxID=3043424 RepID=UPI002482196C|nr:radical SAM protein [Thermodesulfovibrio sp. 1176]MDI1473039.1 radical SAM protein [Thermodesulfovibrio sp. 1176]
MFNIYIKPTELCNLKCDHCYIPLSSRENSFKMTPEQVDYILDQCLNFFSDLNKVNLIFHGGEPLLMGVGYYGKFLDKLKQNGVENIRVSFQSNMLLYNKEWKLFLKQNKASIGTSYDFFSNFRRLAGCTDSKKYFILWTQKIKQYQDDFRQRVYTITVLSKQNVKYIPDIIDIAEELGLNLKLNPLYNAGKIKADYKSFSLTPQEYGESLKIAYRCWQKYKNKGMVIEQCKDMESFVTGESSLTHTRCPYAGNCVGHIWCIDPKGNIYNCGCDVQLGGKYYMGNYKIGINKEKYIKAKAEDNQISLDCYECGICGGGCKLFRDKKTKKYLWCDSYKKLYKEVKNAFC